MFIRTYTALDDVLMETIFFYHIKLDDEIIKRKILMYDHTIQSLDGIVSMSSTLKHKHG